MAALANINAVTLGSRAVAGRAVAGRKASVAARPARANVVVRAAAKERIFNFSAGPACLPLDVLEEMKEDMVNYKCVRPLSPRAPHPCIFGIIGTARLVHLVLARSGLNDPKFQTHPSRGIFSRFLDVHSREPPRGPPRPLARQPTVSSRSDFFSSQGYRYVRDGDVTPWQGLHEDRRRGGG
jgi:hypothetical protein